MSRRAFHLIAVASVLLSLLTSGAVVTVEQAQGRTVSANEMCCH